MIQNVGNMDRQEVSKKPVLEIFNTLIRKISAVTRNFLEYFSTNR